MLSVLVALVVMSADITLAYSLRDFTEDVTKTILPFVGVLFLMIAFPIGMGLAWNHVPGMGKIGLAVAMVLLEISLPMALPSGIGKNYRDLWNKIF